jgi:transketolase
VALGGYVVVDWPEDAESNRVILIASGSELHLAIAAGEELVGRGIAARVVSMPSWELFEAQVQDYRETVLPREVKARVAVEAGITLGWDRYVGLEGEVVGLDRFGASAPYQEVLRHLGITVERVVEKAVQTLEL